MSAALFAYTVRESLRARSIQLRVTPQKGLEVVLPRGCSRARIPPLLERQQRWIRSALERAEAYRARFPPAPAWQVPGCIVFPAIQRAWQVELHPAASKRVTVREHGVRPFLHGANPKDGVFGAFDQGLIGQNEQRWIDITFFLNHGLSLRFNLLVQTEIPPHTRFVHGRYVPRCVGSPGLHFRFDKPGRRRSD